MANIRSLGDFASNKDDDKKKTSSFTGGEKSGLAVENPSDEDCWPTAKYTSAPEGSRRVVVYKNGFRVDDGPFRSSNIPENEKFIKELQAGYAPRELMDGSDGQSVHVALEDKRNEIYTSNQNNCKLFSGEGNSLCQSSRSVPIQPIDLSKGSKEIVVDQNKAVTSLQIRFHSGKKVMQQFNQDHTIGDLHNFLMSVAPVDGEYKVVEGFPPKEITADASTTLKDAGLLQAVITQILC